MSDTSKDQSKTTEKQPAADVAFEEDSFEEFDNEEWAVVTHEEENQDLWEADWDDDDRLADDFAGRLQSELDKSAMKE